LRRISLIAGNGASKPMGLEIDPEYFLWSRDEIDALKKEGFLISPEDERELQELNADRSSKTLIGGMGEAVAHDGRLLSFVRLGIILPPWKSAAEGSGGGYAQSGLGLGPGFFLMAVDFPKVLNEGLVSLIAKAETELKSLRHFGEDSLLEAAQETRLPHHTLTLRVHRDTPERLMIKALEVIKTGIGMPASVGDRSYMAYFMRYGVPLEEAREYVLTGCLDANLPGKSRTVAIGMFIVPLVFDIFLHNGRDPGTGMRVGIETGDLESFTDYDQFVGAFKKQLRHFMEIAAEKDNLELLIERELFPDAFRSSLMEDGIAVGKDLLSRMMPFENGAVLNPVGMINVADSLAAVKKLVYDDKKVAMGDLKQALDLDWQGWESLRKLCREAPKYGNGYAYVDAIAADLYAFWIATAEELPTAFGGMHKATAISITSHQPGGALTGATPDGRHAREICADGTVSPMQGRDTHGPTAVMRSALQIDQDPYQATLMNMKFHPSALESEEDLRKLFALIKTYLTHGGKHVQFNVVSKEMLIEAQQNPEQYRDLVVRVAGYSAYFTQLNRAMQDEVIARTELSLGGMSV
jgi:pyruvate-formate lyase